MKYRESLDAYDERPEGMTNYLRHHGWHFSKKMSEWAAKHMEKDGSKIRPFTKEKLDEILSTYGVTLENDVDYDSVFAANMCRADFYGSSITDEQHLALFVKDYVDDEDQADGFIFSRFYSDCCRKGLPIPWEEVL